MLLNLQESEADHSVVLKQNGYNLFHYTKSYKNSN